MCHVKIRLVPSSPNLYNPPMDLKFLPLGPTVAIRCPTGAFDAELFGTEFDQDPFKRASSELYISLVFQFSPSCRGQGHPSLRGKHLFSAHLLFQEYGLVFGNSPVTHGAARLPLEFVRGWFGMLTLVIMHLVRTPFKGPSTLSDRYYSQTWCGMPVLPSSLSSHKHTSLLIVCCPRYLKGKITTSSCISSR